MLCGPRIASFRQRLLARERLLGTFIKTPSSAIVEIIGETTLDCICIDAEHAPFDRAALDVALLAARAGDLPAFVRPSRADPADILNALDLGAAGVFLPHVMTADIARMAAEACHYGARGRGYSGSTRAAGYATRPLGRVIEEARGAITVVAQIEDASALEHLDAIAATDGLDCLFVGRMDLTVSLGAKSPNEPIVLDAVRAICAAGRKADRIVGMFSPSLDDAMAWFEEGATLFVLASDQQWILEGARQMAEKFTRSAGA